MSSITKEQPDPATESPPLPMSGKPSDIASDYFRSSTREGKRDEFRGGTARNFVRTMRLARQFWYDFNRFRRFSSSVGRGDSRSKLTALITMAYHSLEKGMSLTNPRPGFGVRHLDLLLGRLETFGRLYGFDENCRVACNVLEKYQQFNSRHGVEMPRLKKSLELLRVELGKTGEAQSCGGTREVDAEALLRRSRMDLSEFFESRSSVRQYATEPVSPGDVRKAVRMAQKTPCVCNRQSGKVRALSSADNIRDALRIQGGAAGFADQIPTVLVVSSDLSNFQSAGERYQCWIDGGLFAMSLIYALHSLGLVTCCLNWSKNEDVDLEFKERFGIPGSESIIMLISVGHPMEKFQVAESWRRPLEEVLEFDSSPT